MSKHEYAEEPSALRAAQKDLAYRLGLGLPRGQAALHRAPADGVGDASWIVRYAGPTVFWFREGVTR